MEIVKDRLPKGQSYALKPSVLEAALTEAGARTPTTLYQRYHGWWQSGVIFRADFYRVEQSGIEALTVISRALPSEQRAAARRYIESEVIPAFIEWIKWLETLPENSTVRREKQSFTRQWMPETEDAHA